MNSRYAAAVFLVTVVCFLIRPAQAEQRLALVIGNASYTNCTPLPCCTKDANDMAAALREVGFQVSVETDANHQRMEAIIDRFADQVRPGDVALFYYSGHGAQVNGVNYLIPIGMDARKSDDMKYKAVPAEMVLDRLERADSRVNLVILDACRNNPFKRFKSLGDGLAPMTAARGTLIAYATAPGTVALAADADENSPYTRHLISRIKTGGLEVGRLFRQVRSDVYKSTDKKQLPWETTSLMGDFFFVDSSLPDTVPMRSPTRPTPDSASFTNTVGVKMIRIPAGTFLMGSPAGEAERDDDEQQHRVTISKAFYMGSTEVTQGQWKAVMGTEPWKGADYVKEGHDYPAPYLNWEDAVEYCRRLGAKEDRVYRLPTEAEWEYACRAGATTAYSFGDDPAQLGKNAWFDENALNVGEKYAHAVGQKQPNRFGLFDMRGNMWEWCSDWFGDYDSAELSTDPVGPSSGSNRVIRGGSSNSFARDCRAANRGTYMPSDRAYNLGFRLVSVGR